MIAAGQSGLAYCLKKAALESNKEMIWAFKRAAQTIAFNTAVNCWPGWADPGIVIEQAQIRVAIEIAEQNRNLVYELGLTFREHGTAHWLVGALELAAGEFDLALAAFRQAEQSFLAGDETKSLMAHGYIALARKADPRSRVEGAEALNEALERLRVNGSKEALFFADQLATADRVLIG